MRDTSCSGRSSHLARISLAMLLLAVWTAPAHAVGPMSIDVQMFRPNPHISGGFTVDAARVGDHFEWGIGVFVDHADDPLKRIRTDTGQTIRRFVTEQTTMNLLIYAAFLDILEIGLDLPFTVNMDGSTASRLTDSSMASLAPLASAPLLMTVAA